MYAEDTIDCLETLKDNYPHLALCKKPSAQFLKEETKDDVNKYICLFRLQQQSYVKQKQIYHSKGKCMIDMMLSSL